MASRTANWPGRAFGLFELALLALIAFVLVKAVLTYIWPQSVWKPVAINTAAAVNAASTSNAPALNLAFDPFYRARGAAAPVQNNVIGEDAPETTLDLKLFGLRADSLDETGSAILETPDRVQQTYRIGDEIISNVFLRAVTKSYIVLEAGGQLERLTFNKRESKLTAAMTKPEAESVQPAKARPAQISLNDFIVRVKQVSVNGGPKVKGLTVMPRGDGAAFAQAGFKPGDVIIKVNGLMLTNPAAMKQFENAKGGTFTVLRNNRTMTIQVGQ